MAKKRILDNDERNDTPHTRQKLSRNGDGNTPALQPGEASIQSDEMRLKRSGHGQGGAIAKLVNAVKKIRPDLYPKEPTPDNTNIPPSTAENAMAPAVPKPRQRKGVTAARKKLTPPQDSPLKDYIPVPAQHKVPAGDGRYGFKPATQPPPKTAHSTEGTPTASQRGSITNMTERNRDTGGTPTQQRPRPRAVYGKSNKERLEVIPDSEEESTQKAISKGSHHLQARSDEGHTQEVEHQSWGGHHLDSEHGVGSPGDNSESESSMDNREEDTNLDINLPVNPVDLNGVEFWPGELEMQCDLDTNLSTQQNKSGHQQDMEIDEQSPDEDDAQASAALRASSQANDGNSECDASYSVLAAHQEKNGRVHPPHHKSLETSRRHQALYAIGSVAKQTKHQRTPTPAHQKHKSTKSDDEGADNEGAESSGGDLKNTHTSGHSILKDTLKPTQMAFYKDNPAWTDVLNNAKDEFRLYIHTQVGFQERSDGGLQKAWDCVLEEISKYNDDPDNMEPLDERLYNKQAMSILVFEEGATSRGALKTLCRTLTFNHLSEFLSPTCNNQLEHIELVKKNVKILLKKGHFLQGGKDEEGRTRNFGHPLIADICQQFYYNGKSNCLSVLFPEEFYEQLPAGCLALVCTCIQNCISEFKTGFLVGCSFKGTTYGQIYLAMLKLIDQVQRNENHRRNLEETLQNIARRGRMQSCRNEVDPEDLDLEVILD